MKVKLKVFPGARAPELNAPWSAVTVWVKLSLFVQVILVPTFTVRLAGLKAKLSIVMLFPLLVVAVVGVSVGTLVGVGVGVGAVVGAVVGTGVGLLAVPPPQAVNRTRKLIASKQDQTFVAIDGRFFKITLVLLKM